MEARSLYDQILNSFAHEKIFQADEDDWQGSSIVIYHENANLGYWRSSGKFGYLVFGWGSCSGCDALLACNNSDEYEALRLELLNKIKWFANKELFIEHVNTYDWAGCCHFEKMVYEKLKDFVNGEFKNKEHWHLGTNKQFQF